MRINLKQLLLVIFCYINPIVIYWYSAFYPNRELVFSFPASVLLSGAMLLVFNNKFTWRWWQVLLAIIASNFFVAIVLQILGHLVIGAWFLGFDKLGVHAVTGYFVISLITPIFWINSFVLITACFMSKANLK